jgi:LPS export ABC transporter permease LptG
MTVLFRWVFFSTLARIVAITIAVVSVFMIAESFDKARAIGDGMTVRILVEYLILKVPYMISEFMPVVVLIATAVYITELSHNNELVAIRATGVSAWLLILPLLAAGLTAGLFTFSVGEWVEPITNERLAHIERVNIEKKPPLKQGEQWLKDDETLIRITPLADKYFSLLLLSQDEQGGWKQRIDAKKAYYKQGAWQIEQAFISKPDAEKGVDTQEKKQMVVPSSLGPKAAVPPSPRDMGWLELYHFEQKLSGAGLESIAYQFQLQRKLSSPLGCLIMVILAYSLCASMGERSGAASKGLLLSVSIGLLFYIMSSAISVFVSGQQMPAVYAAWLPNLLFLGIAGYLLLKKEGY